MLPELIEAARRFRASGEITIAEAKAKTPRWIIEITDATGAGALLKGPYRPRDVRPIRAPDRQKSGQISPTNLKPYLLMDRATYALGIAAPGAEAVTALAHRSFVDLVRAAATDTADPDVAAITAFLDRPLPDELRRRIAPEDLVTFQAPAGDFPAERAAVQAFWSAYLSATLTAPQPATCAGCGRHGPVLRLLPREVVILGQKCGVVSFNDPAYWSFGKEQTTNAPLCYACGAGAVQALDFLTRDRRHRATVARDVSKGRPDPLRNHLAVFWLREPAQLALGGQTFDLEAALAAIQAAPPPPADGGTPPPDLAQVEALLAAPWHGQAQAGRLQANAFCLAVLSANKGRLVVRDWLAVSLDGLRTHVLAYLRALRLTDPSGEAARAFPIATLTAALRSTNPQVVRGLLRTAYLGLPPPQALLPPALHRLRDPKTRAGPDWQPLLAVLKLARTHGTEEAERMDQLDPERGAPAYHCGRLLAVLEEAQRRASGGRINVTLVDRFYGAASTTPARTLGVLLRQAETAHLPKVRRGGRGYTQLQTALEAIMARFAAGEGLPRVLLLDEQAEFALGYYH